MSASEASHGVDELVVVGCGTVVPEPDRGASSYWVAAAGRRLLFDCGPGAVQGLVRLGLGWNEIDHLVITHFHADHVGALPGLFFAFKHGLARPRSRPLEVHGPVGTGAFFERLAAAFGDFMLDPGFPVGIREVRPADAVALGGDLRLAAHKTPHTDESLAYRLDGPFDGFGYSGDTGPSDSLGPFMAGVGVLVCECSLFDHEVSDNHLSPGRVAAIAAAARPSTLILTHVYPHVRARGNLESLIVSAGYEGDMRVAAEGLRVALTNR